MIIKNILIITDCTDIAYTEMYSLLIRSMNDYGLTNNVNIYPIAAVKAFSVINASFIIRLMGETVDHPTTIFIAVVNGLSSNPQRIIARTDTNLTLVGNNSGYFNWLFEDFGVKELYLNPIDREINSLPFGGKNVQIPTAAKIIANVPIHNLGQRVNHSIINDFKISNGTVVHIDNFGLAKIKHERLVGLIPGQKLRLYINEIEQGEVIYSENFKQELPGKKIIFNGSSLDGLPELGVVASENSAEIFNLKIGDKITWIPIKK